MCLEFLDVSLRPFATHCFAVAVLLCLRNFQLLAPYLLGRVLTHRKAETIKQKPRIAPSRHRLRAFFAHPMAFVLLDFPYDRFWRKAAIR
jgi:hypothetical protein